MAAVAMPEVVACGGDGVNIVGPSRKGPFIRDARLGKSINTEGRMGSKAV